MATHATTTAARLDRRTPDEERRGNDRLDGDRTDAAGVTGLDTTETRALCAKASQIVASEILKAQSRRVDSGRPRESGHTSPIGASGVGLERITTRLSLCGDEVNWHVLARLALRGPARAP